LKAVVAVVRRRCLFPCRAADLSDFLKALEGHSPFSECLAYFYFSGLEQREALDGLGRLGERSRLATWLCHYSVRFMMANFQLHSE
jgi:hypothetical protein